MFTGVFTFAVICVIAFGFVPRKTVDFVKSTKTKRLRLAFDTQLVSAKVFS